MRQYHKLLAAGVNCYAVANLGQNLASRMWPNEPIDFMQRKILRTLRDEGPLTLAELARKHLVTRQHSRKVVQSIVDTGFVEMKLNPAHKRSMLVSLTDAGLDYIDQHDQKVCAFLEVTLGDVDDNDLEVFSRVSGELRNAFENKYILLEFAGDNPVNNTVNELPT
jgi:DNA-binding MarR family transcriptional regulator